MVSIDCKCKFPYNPEYFKEEAVNDVLTISDEMLDIVRIVDMIVEPSIMNMRFVETTEGTSHEGQIATGYKVIVEAKFRKKVLYVGDQCNQPVQGAHFDVPKNFSITVPKEIKGVPFCDLYDQGLIRVDTYIEKIYARRLDCRAIQCCTLVFLNLVVR